MMETQRYIESLSSTTQRYQAEYEAKSDNIFTSLNDQIELHVWCPASRVEERSVGRLENEKSSGSDDGANAELEADMDAKPFSSMICPSNGHYKVLRSTQECREHFEVRSTYV